MKACIPDKRCLICDEVISNPICPGCINREIRDWILNRDIELIENDSFTASTTCVICGNGMDICPSCYVNEVFEIIHEKYPNDEDEFKILFNYQLRHKIVE